MPKIVSRVQEEDTNIERLNEILHHASKGATLYHDNMTDLVNAADIVMASYMAVLGQLQRECILKDLEIMALEETQRLLLKGIEDLEKQARVDLLDVAYDDDLEHVTTEMMEMIIASGGAEPTFDGEIAFRSDVAFSPTDLKPMVRRAIVNWLELKLPK